jgi:hypothetical protein
MAGYPPQQQPSQNAPPPPPQQGGGCLGCSMGCVIFLLVLALLCGGGLLYVYFNWQVWAGDAARQVVVEAIKKSELQPADQDRVIVQVDRIIDEFKAGKISVERLGEMLKKVADSPLMPLVVVKAFEEQHLKKSSLPDDEKAAAELVLQRVARGVAEKKIEASELTDAIESISEKQGETTKVKENLTEEDLRGFIEKLEAIADEKMISDEPFVVDIPTEFEKLVDELLKTP